MAYDPANPTPGQDPYDALRKKAVTDAGAAGQQGMDAITRRYAAMGNLNSGSYAQSLKDSGRQTQQDQETALGSINQQQVQDSLPFKQQEIQNTFQGGQNAAQLAQQQSQFTSGQAQQQGQFTQSQGQQASQFGQTLPLQQRQLDLEQSQQGLDEQANEINQELGDYQNKHSGGFLGGGGTFGAGAGTVFCTELHRQGWLSNLRHKKASIYGARMLQKSPDMFYGYQAWAKPIVRLMRKYKLINRIMTAIIKPWALEITGTPSVAGKIVLVIFKLISKPVGFANRYLRGRDANSSQQTII